MKSSEQDEFDEKTGRWNQDEHQSFMEGIRLYGKNWKLVAQHIGTRSSTQVRSHAQKYFLRETTRQKVKQQAKEFFNRPYKGPKSDKIDAATQYGEGVTFLAASILLRADFI